MGTKTKIQWCDITWSPWLGCRKVSEGCEHCYIPDTPALRFRGIKHGAQRVRTSESYWKQPLAWDRKAAKEGKRPRVFPSLCDPFDKEAPFEWFKDLMDLVVHCPNLDWLLLTKRIEQAVHSAADWAADRGYNWTGFPPNVWLGVSCENQEMADKRIPILLSIPAKVRWVSAEPLLGPIESWFGNQGGWLKGEKVDWVVVGGESGRSARPCNVEWIRNLVGQCKVADVPVFVKQLGAFPVTDEATPDGWPAGTELQAGCMDERLVVLRDQKGGDSEEWPADLRVQQFPEDGR